MANEGASLPSEDFELDFRAGFFELGFLVGVFQWFYTRYFVSGGAHEISRSFLDGGERELQV